MDMTSRTYLHRTRAASALKSSALLGLCFLAPVLAWGQIRLGCEITPTLSLQFEPVHAVVTIQNNTGEPLDFSGQGNAELEFRITNDQTDEFLAKRPVQLKYNLVIPPGSQAKVKKVPR